MDDRCGATGKYLVTMFLPPSNDPVLSPSKSQNPLKSLYFLDYWQKALSMTQSTDWRAMRVISVLSPRNDYIISLEKNVTTFATQCSHL